MERHDDGAVGVHGIGHGDRGFLKGDRRVIHRQAIKRRAVERGKSFEFVERAFIVKDSDIAFKRIGRVEYPRAAARRFFQMLGMGRGIRAEKDAGRS